MVFICFHVVLCLFFLSVSFGRMFFLYFGRKSEFETRCWVDKTFFLFKRLLSCCCYQKVWSFEFFSNFTHHVPQKLLRVGSSWIFLKHLFSFFFGGGRGVFLLEVQYSILKSLISTSPGPSTYQLVGLFQAEHLGV